MSIRIIAALAAALATQGVFAAATDYKTELLQMGEADQAAMHRHGADKAAQAAVIEANTARLKQIVKDYGWPRLSIVGEEASQSAWLIVQHADNDPAWQREALALMEAMLATGDVIPANVAYLRDRVLRGGNQPQLYGTQGRCIGSKLWESFPILEPARVDERRAAMKMPPLRDYVAKASNQCKVLPP
ncbi:MAG: DUF6624 domain-containing protein [Massilia sp.]